MSGGAVAMWTGADDEDVQGAVGVFVSVDVAAIGADVWDWLLDVLDSTYLIQMIWTEHLSFKIVF